MTVVFIGALHTHSICTVCMHSFVRNNVTPRNFRWHIQKLAWRTLKRQSSCRQDNSYNSLSNASYYELAGKNQFLSGSPWSYIVQSSLLMHNFKWSRPYCKVFITWNCAVYYTCLTEKIARELFRFVTYSPKLDHLVMLLYLVSLVELNYETNRRALNLYEIFVFRIHC